MRKIATTVILCLIAQFAHALDTKLPPNITDPLALTEDTNFIVDPGNTGTISGVISGSYAITKSGEGTLDLTGANTVNSLAVNEGTLNAGADSITGIKSNSVNGSAVMNLTGDNTVNKLTGDGTFGIADGVTGTFIGESTKTGSEFGGVVTGGGNVVIGNGSNTGTITFNGVNNYTGTTTIQNMARLNVTVDGALNSSSSVTVYNFLDIDETTQTIQSLNGIADGRLFNKGDLTVQAGTWNGIISGVGSLNVDGNFTINTIAQTYTGATTVSSGTLNLGSADAIKASSGLYVAAGGSVNATKHQAIKKLTGGGNVTGDAFTYTVGGGDFSGNMSGTMGLTVDNSAATGSDGGTGTLVLRGANTYSGATSVSAGTLVLGNVNATQNSTITVGSDGTLGAINGANMDGLILQSGSTLQVQLDVNTPNTPVLNTTNTATVNNGASLVIDLGGNAVGPQQRTYTLFDADAMFDPADLSFTNTAGRIRFGQLLENDTLFLWLSGGLYGDYASLMRPNARGAAFAIDAFEAAGGSSPLTQALGGLSGAQIPGAINQLPGDVFAASQVAVVDLRKSFNGLLPTFQNAFGEYVPPMTTSYRRQSADPRAPQRAGTCGPGLSPSSNRDVSCYERARDHRSRLVDRRCEYWATPTGRWIDRSSQSGYYGYGLGNAGIALGVSRQLNRNHHIGLAVGYDYANLDMHDISQKDEFHAVNAALYGGYVDRCQFFDWQIGYGKNFHNTERTVAFNGFYAKPSADYDDDVFALGLMYGRRCGSFLPSVGLELVQVWTPTFLEDGTTGAELRGVASDYTSVELPIGFRLQAAFRERGLSPFSNGDVSREERARDHRSRLVSELRAFWVPQLGDQSSRIGTAFAAGGGEFLVDSGDFGWQHVRLGSGLTARFSRCWYGSLNYDAALYSGTTRQTASVSLTARF